MPASVPEEFRSKSPEKLRDLVARKKLKIESKEVQFLLDTAGEIEGSEQAYSELVMENKLLRERIARLEANLKAAIALVPTNHL